MAEIKTVDEAPLSTSVHEMTVREFLYVYLDEFFRFGEVFPRFLTLLAKHPDKTREIIDLTLNGIAENGIFSSDAFLQFLNTPIFTLIPKQEVA